MAAGSSMMLSDVWPWQSLDSALGRSFRPFVAGPCATQMAARTCPRPEKGTARREIERVACGDPLLAAQQGLGQRR